MFRLSIKSLTLTNDFEPQKANSSKKNVFLDVWSEGQVRRRFFVGRWQRARRKELPGIAHYSRAAVMMELRRGPLLRDMLGRQNLYEFLDGAAGVQTLTLPFGRGPVYQLEVVVERVERGYSIELVQLSCLAQVSSKLRRDAAYVEVEHNHSPWSVHPGACNVHHVGDLASNLASSGPGAAALRYQSLANSLLTFFVRGYFSDHILGRFFVARACELQRPRASHSDTQSTTLGAATDDEAYALVVLPVGRGEARVVWLTDATQVIEVAMASSEGGSYVARLAVSLWVDESGGFTTTTPQVARTDDAALWMYRSEYDVLAAMSRAPPLAGAAVRSGALPSPHGVALAAAGGALTSDEFGQATVASELEVLVDGAATFERMYWSMMAARHTISILAWELSLSFGLILETRVKAGGGSIPQHSSSLADQQQQRTEWVTLADVLVWQARRGVHSRVVVWRHQFLSHLTRVLYLGSVSIEYEAAMLQRRCQREGVRCRVIQAIHERPNMGDAAADPYAGGEAEIVLVIVGNPLGVLSSHHEKLILIDAGCSAHATAFAGGFDIARGRYDQPLHQLPRPYWRELGARLGVGEEDQRGELRYSGPEVQPLLHYTRFLWHDVHCEVRGPAVQTLQLHFVQRWAHAFGCESSTVRALVHVPPATECMKRHDTMDRRSSFRGVPMRISRCWNGVVEGHRMHQEFIRVLDTAQHWLYIEHQYPLQNFALVYYLCRALHARPDLRVLIVTPVKTDLPKGVVGDWIDWSQDQIIDNLNLVYEAAPSRVVVAGLVRQDERTGRIKPIYVHSKVVIADGQRVLLSSANMDNMSFFYSSELCLYIEHAALARSLFEQLVLEHLHGHAKPDNSDFFTIQKSFRTIGLANYSAASRAPIKLLGRPILLVPRESYSFWMDRVYYPTRMSKLLYKLGLDTEDIFFKLRNRL